MRARRDRGEKLPETKKGRLRKTTLYGPKHMEKGDVLEVLWGY